MLSEKMARDFIEDLQEVETPLMKEMKRRVELLGFSHEEIFRSQVSFLQTICLAAGVREILELGTFLGYSTAGFAQIIDVVGDIVHITTVDQSADRVAEARQLLHGGGLSDYVTFIVGKDHEVCEQFVEDDRKFDLIFLDTYEGGYPSLFPICANLLNPRGLLIIDNILMPTVDGWISGQNVVQSVESEVLSALSQVLSDATSDERFVSSIIPLGSGLMICYKK